MATEDLTEIITKALTDETFRQKLMDSVEEAVSGYNLGDEEMSMLRNLKTDAFADLDMDVEERQSKSGLGFLTGLMGGREAGGQDVSALVNVLMSKYGRGG